MDREFCAHGREQKCIQAWKPEGKRPLARPRHKQGDKIMTYRREIGKGSMDRINLDQDRDQLRAHVNTVMNLRFP
jgi:hypothetical protein